MERHKVPSFASLWQKHESLYISIFTMALQRLPSAKCDVSNEGSISEYLCPILKSVCFEKGRADNCEVRTPDWEKPIQPVNVCELRGGKTGKRPDFTCKLTNPLASCVDEYEIMFHVECKRLGAPTSPKWILNKNYVANGILRFDSELYEYGKRAASGMMIGYIVSMSSKEILDEVNNWQKRLCSHNPDIEQESENGSVCRLRQEINRRNLEPRLFNLFHLWVDLRKSLLQTPYP